VVGQLVYEVGQLLDEVVPLFYEVGQLVYEVGQLLDEVVPLLYEVGQLLYEVGQLLDEVSPLTYEVGQLGYGRLAHIYEKKAGEEPGNKAIISGRAGVHLPEL